ncbi:MAG: carboxylesterase family protein [Roseovarius sp.]|uniref:alpha/beta hydrolase n=1 Tax=Roseobacteraceae TaxID=2854170 RepID=UPI0032EBC870
MEFGDFDRKAGSRVAADVVFGHAPLGGQEVVLRASVYLPKPGGRPPPLLVWIHGGGFRDGSHDQLQIRRLARQLTIEGFALATPEYRLGAEEADLSVATRTRLEALERLPVEGEPWMAGAAAIAATEDVAAFLGWLEEQRGELGFAGRPVLGGSGAGAVTAFNAAYLAPFLKLARPEPGGILSYSGGFAWPELYEPGKYPVFALHNPFDEVLGIGSIRALSQIDPEMELIEAWEQEHGLLRVHPQETKPVTFGRIRAMLAAWAEA